MHGGGRSNETSTGLVDEDAKLSVPVEVQLDRLQRHASESTYLRRFLAEQFLPEMLQVQALRSLLAMRKCAKEVSESYGACLQAIALLVDIGRKGMAESAKGALDDEAVLATCFPRGRGAVILDVCCGRGMTGSV